MLDFGLDPRTTTSNIQSQLELVISNINNSGILQFTARLDDASLSNIQAQLESLGSAAQRTNSVAFSNFTGANVSTRNMSAATAEITRARIANMEAVNVEKVAEAQHRRNTAAINEQAAALRLANVANRQSTSSERQTQAAINKSITKYNQLSDYMQKYQEGLKRNPQLLAKGQALLKAYDKDGELYGQSTILQENRLRSYMQECKKAGIQVDSLGAKFKRLFTEHMDIAIAMAGIHMLQQSIRQLYQNVVELDSAVTNLQIASGYSRSQTKELVGQYNELATQIGATTVEVANAADGWMRQGYSVEESAELVKDSMILSKLGQIESTEATTALTSALKGYKLEVEDGISVVDKLTVIKCCVCLVTSIGHKLKCR